MDELTNDDQSGQENDQSEYLSQLVGEGRKYKTPEELAKAYTHADSFIESLKSQNEEILQELEKKMKLEDLVKPKSEPSDNQPEDKVDSAPQDTPAQDAPDDRKALDEDAIIAQLEKKLAEKQANQSRQQNEQEVTNSLIEIFGEEKNVGKALAEKANELGVDVDYLVRTAQDNPNVFYRLTGFKDDQRKGSSSPQQTRSSEAMNTAPRGDRGPEEGTAAWYDAKRKEMGTSKYLADRNLQLQKHKDAIADPQKFFGQT